MKLPCQYRKNLYGNLGCETSEQAVCKLLYFIKHIFDANILPRFIYFTVRRTHSTVVMNEIDLTHPVVFYSITNEYIIAVNITGRLILSLNFWYYEENLSDIFCVIFGTFSHSILLLASYLGFLAYVDMRYFIRHC